MTVPARSLKYMIDHVIFPPRLPSNGDNAEFQPEDGALLGQLSESLDKFAADFGHENRRVFETVSGMIAKALFVLDHGGRVNEASLLQGLQEVASADAILPIYIKAQNAALFVRKQERDIIFEPIELSPPNHQIMSIEGRLQRCFPERAMAVPFDVFQDTGFRTTLASTIVKMSCHEVLQMKPTAKKSNNVQIEDRETTDPKLVTELLMSFLEASGGAITTPRTWKNTRDEVSWSNARIPWRRSPVWLLARVAMQTTFSRLLPSGQHYKEFMVFFTADILRLARNHDTPSDLLHCIVSKITRRLAKLEWVHSDVKPAWLTDVEETIRSGVETMQQTWSAIMNNADRSAPAANLGALDFARDCATALPELDGYIKLVQCNTRMILLAEGRPSVAESPQAVDRTRQLFSPAKLTSQFPSGLPPPETLAAAPSTTDRSYVLAAFERWVESLLDIWLHVHVQDIDTCGSLSRLMQQYHQTAASHYKSNPENMSIMVLTCLELWVAGDKSACQRHPLLLDYDPCVSSELLQSLLLPRKAQMQRLLQVEAYLTHRRVTAKPGRPSIFTSFGKPNSFAVRFYASSPVHQALLAEIEAQAGKERDAKKEELARLKQEYDRLMGLHSQADCEYQDVYKHKYRGTVRQHKDSCRKCLYQQRAKALQINLHEWPLPTDRLHAQAVVFEIDCPRVVDDWRDFTMFAVLNVLGCEYVSESPAGWLYSPDACLGSYIRHPPQRLRLISEAKPHTVTHRSSIQVALATVATVCVNNGLKYQYYDAELACFADRVDITENMPNACTYQLQIAKSLQDFIYRPHFRPDGPPPNVAVSSQSLCPQHMSLEEYKALATLPLGHRIQWLNILTQLSMPSVDLKKVDTNLMLLQMISQAGPNSDGSVARDGHQDLQDDIFGQRLLDALRTGFERIRENWESCEALGSLVAIAARLLSLNSSSDITETCLGFLSSCRYAALSWVRNLRNKAAFTSDMDHRDELLLKVFEIAQVCAGTFDIDRQSLKTLLGQPSETSVLLQCAIIVQTTAHAALTHTSTVTNIRHQRWQRLASRALPLLVDAIKSENRGLDMAIQATWIGYSRATAWTCCASESQHWMTAQTEKRPNATVQTVHFNLLSGELLVDGLPLSRLPSSYEQHATYQLLFGRSTLEVMPTSMAGMEFSALKSYKDHEVYFGLHSYASGLRDLRVTTVYEKERLDLIPERLFVGKLPDHFVRRFTHWYRHSTDSVILRPHGKTWASSPRAWTLTREHKAWIVHQGSDMSLLSMTSRTSTELQKLLGSVESAEHTHLILRAGDGHVDVVLPRLRLNFVLRKQCDVLESREFRGMHVSPDRQIGTLVGLQSKLVLRDFRDQCVVLIPNGTVSYQRLGQHVSVKVELGTSTRVRPYAIDCLLGRIVDNGTLESKLRLCYLHALTSFCVPDDLTKKTGTEQALEILNSAAVRSFNGLSTANADVLRRIARLSPSRTYYPAHERGMQTVVWDEKISFLSQHGRLYTDVASVLAEAASLEFFYEGKPERLKMVSRGDLLLLKRDLARSSMYRSSCFGAELRSTATDRVYASRDRASTTKVTSRYSEAFHSASKVFRGLDSRHSAESPSGLGKRLWDYLLSGLSSIKNGRMEYDGKFLRPSLFGYNAEHVQDWKAFLGVHWCQIHRALTSRRHHKFSVMMFLATMAFLGGVEPRIIEVLGGLFTSSALREINVPDAKYFDLKAGYKADLSTLKTMIRELQRPIEDCPEIDLPQMASETAEQAYHRREQQYSTKLNNIVDDVARYLLRQWPCETLVTPAISCADTYLRMSSVMESASRKFKLWWDNHRFFFYLNRMETVMKQQVVRPLPPSMSALPIPTTPHRRPRAFLVTSDLYAKPAPVVPHEAPRLPADLICSEPDADELVSARLSAMIDFLDAKSSRQHEKNYVDDLRQSSAGLLAQAERMTLARDIGDIESDLHKFASECQEYLEIWKHAIEGALDYTTHIPWGGVAATYNAPRVSTTFLLQQLGHKRSQCLPSAWKKATVTYGLAISACQRAQRLLSLCSSNARDLIKDLTNPGHENWDPYGTPETLLMEIQSGILVRKVQADIGAQMMNPQGGHNAVMQLNMGEGKSSVIIPMTAAGLADGSRLVRVIVGKAQSKQMLEILISMVAGLCNRRIYHMPFTRSLKLGTSEAETIYRTYKSCMEDGGILLVQPEQILSFQLMSIETNLSGRPQISESLLKTQHFFHACSRDIVDESDENFSVKFELVYTIGTQRSIDYSPQRWSLIQSVLGIIRRLAPQIKQEHPQSLEIEPGPIGPFPRTRILREDAQNLLCQRLAEEICQNGLPCFPSRRQSTSMQKAIFDYITKADLDPKVISLVESTFWTDSTKYPLLLLRGLLAGGVIGFALGHKRWRVNYGLDHARQPPTKLAVPYRAKDSPALRSEFSHPDVVIILTCLSHYYSGLSEADLFTALEQVLKSDQAEDEYQAWVKDAPTLPAAFRTLSGVNPKDRLQCTQQIFPHLRQAQAVVNFFLSRVIFPKELKEFPHKLSASGWDLAQQKMHPTTGFSGTNDLRHLLPLSIQHVDLPDQKHTNALVLKQLLQPETSVCLMPVSGTEPQLSDAERLLQLVMNLPQPAQVILDVGAQILELSNVQVAKAWLAKAKNQLKKEAVVFFDDSDELCVLDSAGATETFQTSPYAKQLDRCLVFLDEAHTRGTDLKLPEDYRAVVTLGANLTKDRLVQACMRMRKLGKGQSVVFCVSNEIQTKIRTICGKGAEQPLEVFDVLVWSINETYADLRKSMPLWATQGARFERQDSIWQQARTETALSVTRDQADCFLEQEALSLEDRYRPHPVSEIPDAFADSQSSSRLNQIWERCKLFDSTQFSSATLQEEQERELSPEIEAERQIERPRQAEPMPHQLHPHVVDFVGTGKIPSSSPAFVKAFLAFERTTAAAHFRVQEFPCDLLATKDFTQTVRLTGKGSYSDDYQRPVQWILTTGSGSHMVVISPYEATRLRSAVAKSSAVTMHIYAPRPNLAFKPLDDLRLFTIPPLPDAWKASSALVLQLNLFAGQLYFGTAKEYRDFCDYLCLAWRHMDEEDAMEGGVTVLADGFVVPQPGRAQAFQVSPTKFLQVIIAKMRRNGEGIDKTHYGRVLEGELLTEEDFEGSAGVAVE